MQFELNNEEAEVVLHVLRRHLPNLRAEVYRTENYDWRQEMKRDEATIKELIARLEDMAEARPV